METIENQTEASKWKRPHHQFKQGDELILTTVNGQTFIGTLCRCGDFRTTDGEHLRKSAIWRVAKLDKVLRSSGFVPPSEGVVEELMARVKDETRQEQTEAVKLQIMKMMLGSFLSQGSQKPQGEDRPIRWQGKTVWSNSVPIPDPLKDLLAGASFMSSRKSGKTALQESLLKALKGGTTTVFVDELNLAEMSEPLKTLLEEAFKNHPGKIFPFPFPLR